MELFNIESFEEVKWIFKIFLFFIIIPALSWWWNFITGFFFTEYEDDGNNCCPHCHTHAPNPIPPHDLSGGGMAVPPMKIPEREQEYIRRR